MSDNPLALIAVDSPPGPEVPGDQHIHPLVTVPPAAYFGGHFHPCDNPYDHGEIELYMYVEPTGTKERDQKPTLTVWRRPDTCSPWERVELSARNTAVAVPPGWQHCGMNFGPVAVMFMPFTRADHLQRQTIGPDGELRDSNPKIAPLPRAEWPLELRLAVSALELRRRGARAAASRRFP